MKTLIGVLLFFLICLSAGCGKYWYQEGKTFEECKRDRQECFNELQKYSNKEAPSFALGRDYVHRFVKECMEQRGYRLVTEDKLPMRVKRQDPESTPARIIHGLAGTLEHE
jgi:hypothetical protein